MKFLGYPHNSSGYRTYDPVTHKVEEVRALIFWEEALMRSSTFFESQADDLDDPDEVRQPTVIAPHDDWSLPDSVETSDLPPAPSSHIPPPIPAPSACPSHTRRAPTCLEPADFGAYGHRNETVANAYEDLWNGNTLANVTILEDDLMMGLICDDVHLANEIIKQDTTLPGNPSL